ncbi:Kunitz/Bovine pancreatic trypsin inhibitor domain protein, partial [Oesophagostomum dentatum]
MLIKNIRTPEVQWVYSRSFRLHSAVRRRNSAADGGPPAALLSAAAMAPRAKVRQRTRASRSCAPLFIRPSVFLRFHICRCPTGFWCHEGEHESSYYCCPRNRKVTNRCHLPPVAGHGNATMRRFYYDWADDGCHELPYTGVGGNENSFMSYEQ